MTVIKLQPGWCSGVYSTFDWIELFPYTCKDVKTVIFSKRVIVLWNLRSLAYMPISV